MTTPQDERDLVAHASGLLREIEEAMKSFDAKTSDIVSRAEKLIKELDATDLTKEIEAIERDAVKEIDEATFDYAEETDKLGEDEEE